YFSWCTRDHNRRSVKPIPYISASDFEDRVSVRILNNGSGPLILQKVIARHRKDSNLHGHLIDLVPFCPDNLYFTNFTKILLGRALLPGKKVDLIDLEIDLDDPEAVGYREQLRDFLGNLIVVVHFSDIYNSQFPIYTRQLDWFHRHKVTSKASQKRG
ncbi:MAG: hypothetical protein Q8K92_09100, partial [Leadbetterella sp.]|nr:hypothetical protein [Leadbetterella sp.]